jgi:hypothetical protein
MPVSVFCKILINEAVPKDLSFGTSPGKNYLYRFAVDVSGKSSYPIMACAAHFFKIPL